MPLDPPPTLNLNGPSRVEHGQAPWRDGSGLIAALGPLSWLGLPILMLGGGFIAMTGFFYGLAILLFWHLTGLVALVSLAVLRYRRGIPAGRAARFGLWYFAFVNAYAWLTTGRDVFIFVDLWVKDLWLLAVGIGIVSLLVLAFGMISTLRPNGRAIGGKTALAIALAVGGLASALSMYGLSFLPSVLWKKKFVVQVLDADSRVPLKGANLEFQEQVLPIKSSQSRTNSSGLARLSSVSEFRIAVTHSGYRDQVVWYTADRLYVSWIGDDGWMTPFRWFPLQLQRDNETRQLTILLQSEFMPGSPAYPLEGRCPDHLGVAILRSLESGNRGFHPGQVDPQSLPEHVRSRFLNFQQRYDAFFRNLLVLGPTSDRPVSLWETRRGRPVLISYSPSFAPREALAMYIYSLIPEYNTADSFSAADEILALKPNIRARPEELQRLISENRGKPHLPILVLNCMGERRHPLVWLWEARRDHREVGPKLKASVVMALNDLKWLASEAEKSPDPLLHFLARDLRDAPPD